ncbi:hypothetical protein [Bradyrhizobium sp. AZCC 2289]|uniref:hypothetical protein n=1 Tax=Bradyrhizobium sp. AZCC 2289 TaxID=3117026 RepID=UPI002FF06F84
MTPIVHPGRLLKRELAARKLSANRLSLQTKAGAADFVLGAAGKSVESGGLPVVVPPPTAAPCCFARSSTTRAGWPRSTPDGNLPLAARFGNGPVISSNEAPPGRDRAGLKGLSGVGAANVLNSPLT